MNDAAQRPLPFAEAEGTRAERSNLLGLAMLRLGVDAAEARLLDWVFAITDAGGELKKSYDQLAARPRGMCCSSGKARAAVRRLRAAGVLAVGENIYQSAGQAANSYQIHWPGVRALLGLPGVTTEHPPVTTEHPPVTTEHPYIGTLPLTASSCLLGWPAGARPAGGESVLVEKNQTADRWTAADRDRVVEQLHRAGYDHAIASRLARESETALGLAAQAVVDVVAEFLLPANRQRFERCGAIGYRLRNGSWPADGIVSLEAARAGVERRRTKAMESALMRAVKDGRAQRLTDDEIRAGLRGALPEEFCAARGW